jgi:hypothetical protein
LSIISTTSAGSHTVVPRTSTTSVSKD